MSRVLLYKATVLEEWKFIPTSATQSNDAFLLNSDVTVENVTIKDFYYDSGNDKGYAFRFANNFNTTIFEQAPMPHVRNVTVITQGTTTSIDPEDTHGDAGRGAMIDGSVAVQTQIALHCCSML